VKTDSEDLRLRTTALSITSLLLLLNHQSVLAADVMITESGIPFLSVKSPFCAQFESIGGITSSSHCPSPKDGFIDILPSGCHHIHFLIPLFCYHILLII